MANDAALSIAVLTAAVLAVPAAAAAQSACSQPVALFESVRNTVRIVPAVSRVAAPAVRSVPVCAGDVIQVGDDSRAVILILASNTPLAIDQNSEFVVTSSADGATSLIDLVRGALLFITRFRRSVEIRTPFVNAAIEGTEFLIRAEADRTTITVFEGAVRASNPFGEIVVGADQQAVAVQGQAPQLQLTIRPRDAVQWALYYEPVMPADSFEQLALVPEPDRGAMFYIRRASLLLGAGQLTEAESDLQRAQMLEPANGDAYGLRAIVAVALNRGSEALEHGRAAVKSAPRSVAAQLALSYALQANFELDAALDTVTSAVEIAPDNAEAWARLAELRLALDDVNGAADAARQAAGLSPNSARALTALGFTQLARFQISEARDTFERATTADPSNPTAHLGLGLAQIRDGRTSEGRSRLEVAVALNPDNALNRSYLGKAYLAERRDDLAGQEFLQARALDPNEPTAWFYDAIRNQALNRPIEAVNALQRSIDLNDNRAVYRSRLLLDSDLAIRGARLGRLYRDVGFEQLALLEGWKSLAASPSNHSAHRLLADNYLALPRHRIARDSELLQAQLLQPLNLNPVQPRLATSGGVFLDDAWVAGVGFNEFTQLFATNSIRLTGDVIGGDQGTTANNVIVSGLAGRLSYSAGQSHVDSNGIRENNDINQNVYDVFLQGAISAATSAQLEVRHTTSDMGDRVVVFEPSFFFPRQREVADTTSIRFGGRHTFAPGSVVIGSYTRRELDSNFNTGAGLSWLQDERAGFGEIRYIHETTRVNVTGGVGYYRGDRTETLTFGTFEFPPADYGVQHTNSYLYLDLKAVRRLTFTSGVSHDSFRDGDLKRNPLNPKVGLSWEVDSATTIRAAAFKTFERTLISGQTIEPTQIAGFNQFFFDGNAAAAWRYGAAMDRRISDALMAGVETSLRTVSLPALRAPGVFFDIPMEEQLARAYLYATLQRHLALSTEYQLERAIGDSTGNNLIRVARSTTHRAATEARVFHDSGGFGALRVTFVDQAGQFQNPDQSVTPGADQFWVLDASIGYRLPRQRMGVFVELRNALNAEFSFQDSAPREPTIVPKRLVIVRVTFAL